MQTHQSIPHGLLYSVDPLELTKFHMGEHAIQDDFDREEYDSEYYDSEYIEESLASNVISFLNEITGGS